MIFTARQGRGGAARLQVQGTGRGGPPDGTRNSAQDPSASGPGRIDETRTRGNRFWHPRSRVQSRASCGLRPRCSPSLIQGRWLPFLDRAELHHRWIAERIEEFEAPLLVCEPVLAEAVYLLGP